MNTTLAAVGVGGLLLGGVGGFLVGGSGASSSSGIDTTEQAAAKTSRPKVVAIESGRSGGSIPRELDEIYLEPSQTARVQMLLDYYANLDPVLFEEEAAKLEELPFSERILASYLLFAEWGEVDPIAALAQTDKMGRGGFFAKPTVLQSWASSDPQGAAKYLEENPREFAMLDRGPGNGAAGTIATEWARQDPVGALEWAKGLENGSASAVAGVLQQVASDDPAAAVLMAQGLTGDEQSEAYRSIAREWGKDDWSAMESWANGLPATERDAAMAEAIEGLARVNPILASDKALTLAEGEARDRGIEQAVERWSRSDPQAAMDFLMSKGSEKAQQDAMRETMSSLARQDPAAGLAVIGTMTDGDVRDSAVSTFVFSSDTASEEKINLAASIANDDSRARTVGMAAGQWLREDEDAANAFLNSTNLMDQETVSRIRERAANGGGRRGGRGR